MPRIAWWKLNTVSFEFKTKFQRIFIRLNIKQFYPLTKVYLRNDNFVSNWLSSCFRIIIRANGPPVTRPGEAAASIGGGGDSNGSNNSKYRSVSAAKHSFLWINPCYCPYSCWNLYSFSDSWYFMTTGKKYQVQNFLDQNLYGEILGNVSFDIVSLQKTILAEISVFEWYLISHWIRRMIVIEGFGIWMNIPSSETPQNSKIVKLKPLLTASLRCRSNKVSLRVWYQTALPYLWVPSIILLILFLLIPKTFT